MRKVYLLLVVILGISCSQKGYVIDGTVEGMTEGSVSVISCLSTTPDTLAVAQVRDGHFKMRGECEGVIPAVVMIDGQGMGGVPIYLENADYQVELNARNVHAWRIEGGGESQRLSNAYQSIDIAANRVVDNIREDFMEAMDKFGDEQLLQNLPLFYVYSCEVVVRAIRLYFHIREGKCHAIDRQKFDALMHGGSSLPTSA